MKERKIKTEREKEREREREREGGKEKLRPYLVKRTGYSIPEVPFYWACQTRFGLVVLAGKGW